jgi:hypothetical protein
MYVPKTTTQARLNYFMKEKYLKLRKVIGKYDSSNTFYSASAFTAMLNYFFGTLHANGVRIYFASYGPEGTASVPADYGRLLTLIFAPTDNASLTDIGLYYTIAPGGTFDPVSSQLDRELASSWVLNYQSSKLPILNTTLSDPNGDTKSLHYTKMQLLDLRDEIKCQCASGIKAYFCAIPPEETEYKQRLILHFILTNMLGRDEVDFFIEDRCGWDEREIGGNFDTGNPCPPATCGGFGLP